MSRVRKAVVALGTFAVALGTGFVMQYSDALARGEDSVAPPVIAFGSTVPVGIQPSLDVQPTVPDVPRVVILARTSQPDSVQTPAARPEGLVQIAADAPALLPRVETPPAVESCLPRLTGAAAPGAMVALRLDAGCHPGAPVTVHHAGMIISAVTDDFGRAEIDLPALASPAVVLVDVMGQGAMTQVDVPDLAQFDRAVLQWQGAQALDLHALEDGALYGADGDVWSGNPGSLEALLAGRSGMLMTLGTGSAPGQFFAQVYTFPSAASPRSEVVLNVEAEVTAASCGQVIAAQTIQVAPGQPTLARDIAPTLPGCGAVGEFLVLSNMLRDLTLAAR